MNIPSHILIEAGSNNQDARKILDKTFMLDSFTEYQQELPKRRRFRARPQADHIDKGIDAVEVTEEMTASHYWCIETRDFGFGPEEVGRHGVFQGATHKDAVLDAQTVLYFRRCARQMIHEGTYAGAKHCWDFCMGEGPSISKQTMGKILKGHSWTQVPEALTQDERDQAYRLTRSNNRRLKQNKM